MNKEPIGTYIEQALHNVTFRYSSENVTVVSPFLTRKEMAEYHRCSERKIDRMVKIGMLKAKKFGHTVLFSREENRIK